MLAHNGCVAVAGLALLGLALIGVVYQLVGLRRGARAYPPPGQLIDVGGHRLHAVCAGCGTPVVVLESGIAASSLSWARTQPEMARFTRVCAYDRAGLAWSDLATTPRTLARIVSELHALLAGAALPPPLVIVGHSFGAFIALAYSARYPAEVDGIVLIDPPSEWMPMTRRQARLIAGGVQLSRVGGLLARLGVVRVCLTLLTGGAPGVPRRFVRVFGPTAARTLERLVGEVRKLPQEVHPIVQTLWCQPKCFRALADHLRALEDAVASVAMLPPLGDVPMVVISSGDQTADVLASHRAMARRSSRGRHVVSAKSGHWVQFDDPELVVETVRRLVETARQAQRSASRAG